MGIVPCLKGKTQMTEVPIQSKSKCPYVYTLAYPESMGGQIFYVGMGTGHRINAHEREARKDPLCQESKTGKEEAK
jgi:hypothetical protein